MTHELYVICTTLSDGSQVYDIALNDLRIPCPTERDAYVIMDGVRRLLRDHALDEVKVRFAIAN